MDVSDNNMYSKFKINEIFLHIHDIFRKKIREVLIRYLKYYYLFFINKIFIRCPLNSFLKYGKTNS